jgi:AcrR family transcriptional regulator
MSSESREEVSAGGPAEPIWARPAPGSRKPRYTREQIAQAALAIADAEGFEAVSMRRVAAELGAGTMTLYHYVRTKGDLVALMDDAIMGEILVPADELPDDWRGAVTAIAEHSLAAFQRHPWAMTAMRDAREGGPNGMRHFEQSLVATARTGLPLDRRLELIAMVDDYVFGFAMRAADVHAAEHFEEIPPALVDYVEAQLATGDYPNIAALLGDDDMVAAFQRMFALMFDEARFGRGFERLLDGIALELERGED